MDTNKKDIWVYAHWINMSEPKCIGILSAHSECNLHSNYDLSIKASELM
jgi:hypothetical protein